MKIIKFSINNSYQVRENMSLHKWLIYDIYLLKCFEIRIRDQNMYFQCIIHGILNWNMEFVLISIVYEIRVRLWS